VVFRSRLVTFYSGNVSKSKLAQLNYKVGTTKKQRTKENSLFNKKNELAKYQEL
jgi:hypothetical protein